MGTDVNLKDVEKKVFSSYFNDGLWDIYGALLLLGFGLAMVSDWDYFMIPVATIAVVLLLFRQRIIRPRLGLVKFSLERQVKTKRAKIIAFTALIITALLGAAFFILFSTNNAPEWLEIWMANYFFATFGGIQALFVAIAAYVVGVRRYYIYAALIFISYVITGLLRPYDLEYIPVLVAGSIILISGVALLFRFLRRYPLPPKEIDSASC